MAQGIVNVFSGRFVVAADTLKEAESLFQVRAAGMAWELATSR